MTQDEATQLAAKLFAAYDKPRDPLTLAVYVERLQDWDAAIGLRAVDELIVSEKWLPTVAAFIEVAQRLTNDAVRLRAQRHELTEPPLTPEQREENLRRMRELVRSLPRVGRSMPAVTQEDIDYERQLDEGDHGGPDRATAGGAT